MSTFSNFIVAQLRKAGAELAEYLLRGGDCPHNPIYLEPLEGGPGVLVTKKEDGTVVVELNEALNTSLETPKIETRKYFLTQGEVHEQILA